MTDWKVEAVNLGPRLMGMRVAHATDFVNRTGCTVIMPPSDRVVHASASYQGPAPGSREAALMDPSKPTSDVQAVVLTGGSAIGLGSADGVVKLLRERGVGHPTPCGPVPLVPASVIFDIWWSKGLRVPDAQAGYLAAKAAFDAKPPGSNDSEKEPLDRLVARTLPQGSVGGGTGAVVGKWNGGRRPMKGGFGASAIDHGPVVVTAFAVVNAIGDVLDEHGATLAGARQSPSSSSGSSSPRRFQSAESPLRLRDPTMDPYTHPPSPGPRQGTTDIVNTTLVVMATNGRFSKQQLHLLACRVHDGMGLAIQPIHTRHDGDTAYALSCGNEEADLDLVGSLATHCVAAAIRNAVRNARGIPASDTHQQLFDAKPGDIFPGLAD